MYTYIYIHTYTHTYIYTLFLAQCLVNRKKKNLVNVYYIILIIWNANSNFAILTNISTNCFKAVSMTKFQVNFKTNLSIRARMLTYSQHPELSCQLLFQHHWQQHTYNHQHPNLEFLESSKVPREGQ